MTTSAATGPSAGVADPRASAYLPLLLVLFVGSGTSALIYEIVWYQLLQLAVGSTAVSLGVLLATFMGGLCIGSLALPRFFPRGAANEWHPLFLYAGIELLIAVCGLLELAGIPLVERVYFAGAQYGMSGMLLRGAVAAICLLPPTILMGASLPAIVRWIESTPRGIAWWGLLYGANTFGAVFGCLLAGFYLLRVFDMNIATFVAVAINLAVAAISFALGLRTPRSLAVEYEEDARANVKPLVAPALGAAWSIYVAIALSGAAALGSEVVWTRLMGLTFGATVYAFSIILAVFLVGLALGTSAASSFVRVANPRLALGWCQLLAGFGVAWTAYAIADSLPYWPINPQLSTNPSFTFQLDIARSLWAILPATIFWGASFPFAFAAAAARTRDPGATVGGVYAANTAGAIFGALIVSLVLIPTLGTRDSQRIMLGLSIVSGLLVLFPLMKGARSRALELSAGVALGLAILFGVTMDPVPGELIAYGRRIAINAGMYQVLYSAEGRNTSIAVTRWNETEGLQFHVAGKVEASTESYDMKLQRMLGHLPGLVHPGPKRVLVVGFGGGVTAGTFTTYPTLERLVICELEPLIPPASTKYFAKQNYNVMNDARTTIVYDDARHFVAVTPEKFDIITSDPIHPFVKGSATLYSREYFEMVKAHLNPGGIVTQWVPLYESDAATVKSQIATFFEVFPYGTVWANTINGKGYDVVLLGQLDPPKFDLDELQARLDRPEYLPVKQSLADVEMASVTGLFRTYAGSKLGLAPWLKDAAINRDSELRLQYLAGLALNHSEEDAIYHQMLQYWAPPLDLITGSPQRMDELFESMVAGPGPDKATGGD